MTEFFQLVRIYNKENCLGNFRMWFTLFLRENAEISHF